MGLNKCNSKVEKLIKIILRNYYSQTIRLFILLNGFKTLSADFK